MPYSFTEIEKDKSKTIACVFVFLIVFYFVTIWFLANIIVNFIHLEMRGDYGVGGSVRWQWFGLGPSLGILAIAFAIAWIHWTFSTDNILHKIIMVLGAEPLNLNDKYHRMFQNILDEVSVATGGKKITGVIIPSLAMNAFALADFDGNAVIGTTEGVLARLTRPQIEAIVGHEAAHVVSGDCLATTVTTSIFNLYSGMLHGVSKVLNSTRSTRAGGAVILLIIVYVFLHIVRATSYLLKMFISRQREYRADAVAVRLTRDPLALAEALYAIAYHWRGANLPAQELEAIFIVNPKFSALDERSGPAADLFATHPPTESRIGILMDMAHTQAEEIVANVKKSANRPREMFSHEMTAPEQWMVNHEGLWQGPYELAQVLAFGWLTPQTWVQRAGGQVVMAYEDNHLVPHIAKDASHQAQGQCPHCHVSLRQLDYEGVSILQCQFCKGVLVAEKDVVRIVARLEYDFNEHIKERVKALKDEHGYWRETKINRDPKTLLTCPQCPPSRARMNRMFFTAAYPVEIDKCFMCGRIWFDRDELEILQVFIESQGLAAPDLKE